MRRAPERFRRTSWCVLTLLVLGPVVADVHFSTSSHRWCQVHERIEEAPRSHVHYREPRAPGWSEDHSTAYRHEACPVFAARTPATHASLTAMRRVAPMPLAFIGAPRLVAPVRSVLDVAPKQGPPAVV